MGFIDMYVDEITLRTGAAKKIIKANAIFLVSSVICDKNIRIATAIGDQKPNLWFFVVSPSGTRKTTVVKRWGSALLYRINKRIILPDEYTPEELFSILTTDNAEYDGSAVGAYIRDEASGFFASAQRDYMLGAMEQLSKVYDGDDVSRATKGSGLEEIINPYLTVMMCSTPYIYKLFNESMFRQGFLNRFLYIVVNERPRFSKLHMLDGYKSVKDVRDKLINELFLIRSIPNNIVCMVSPSVEDLLNQYRRKIYDEVAKLESDSFVPDYLFRLGDSQVLKLATIFEIDASYQKLSEEQSLPMIGEDMILPMRFESMRKAISYAEARKNDYLRLLYEFMQQTQEREIYTHKKEIERCYTKIKDAGSAGITRKDLIRGLQWHADFLDKVINTLLQSERIKVRIKKTKTKRTVIYYAE